MSDLFQFDLSNFQRSSATNEELEKQKNDRQGISLQDALTLAGLYGQLAISPEKSDEQCIRLYQHISTGDSDFSDMSGKEEYELVGYISSKHHQIVMEIFNDARSLVSKSYE